MGIKLKRFSRELATRNQAMFVRRRQGATIKQIAIEFGVSENRSAFILEREESRQEFELTRAQMGLT